MTAANLLIIHQGALGDFVLTFPAIIQLQNYYSRIDVFCQSGLGKLAHTLGLVANWFPTESSYFASLFSDRIDTKIKTMLRAYEKVLLFSLSTQLEHTINRVTARVSCRIPPKPPIHARIHLTDMVMHQLIDCGLLKRDTSKLEDLFFPVRDNPSKNSKKILLHPGAGSIRKYWPISSFLEIESQLRSDRLKPEFILGPAERGLLEGLRDTNRRVHFMSELTDLADLYQSAGGYIGNDSGATHLAAFLALPTVAIFGPSDPQRWAPLGRRVKIVRPDLECDPCFETDNANCPNPICLTDAISETVINAFYQVYES